MRLAEELGGAGAGALTITNNSALTIGNLTLLTNIAGFTVGNTGVGNSSLTMTNITVKSSGGLAVGTGSSNNTATLQAGTFWEMGDRKSTRLNSSHRT